MSKEQLEQAAKEFCEAEGMGKYAYLKSMDGFMVKFAQSLIGSGKMVEASDLVVEKAYGTGMDSLFRNRISELEKEVQKLRDNAFQPSNTPQSGEVKSLDKCTEQASLDTFGHSYFQCLAMLDEDDLQTLIINIAEMYANQFKHPAYDLLLTSYNELKAENTNWISVNDSMPNVGDKVIFIVDSPDTFRDKQIYGGSYTSDHCFSTPGVGFQASYWMHSPSAPKELNNK